MSTPPYRSTSSQAAALQLFESRRGALVERVALDAHDALVADGVSFPAVRDAAVAWVEAVGAALAGRYAPSAISTLNQAALRGLDRGLGLGAVAGVVQVALGALMTVAVEHDPTAAPALARAAAGIGGEIANTAARSLEERARVQLKRRADRSDRFRDAAGAVAANAFDADSALRCLATSARTTLDCDWAAIALREPDGRLVITALDGRGGGWAQRWTLAEDAGFCERVLGGRTTVTTADPELMGYHGPDPPAAIVAAPLSSGVEHRPIGVLFAGRDHGQVPDDDDAALAAGLAEVGARALETAQRYDDAKLVAAQVDVLADAVRRAADGADQAALALVARAAMETTGSDVALLRVVDDASGELVTRGVAARSPALAAELEGTRLSPADPGVAALLAGRELRSGALGEPVPAPIADRLGPVEAAGLPVLVEGRVAATLVVARASGAFSTVEVGRMRTAAAHAALVVVLDRVRRRAVHGVATAEAELSRLGEALAAGGDEPRVGRLLARLAADALGAERALIWLGGGEELELVAGYGFRRDELAAGPGRALAAQALRLGEPVLTGVESEGVAALAGTADLPAVLSAPLDHREQPLGVLQLLFSDRDAAAAASRSALGAFVSQAAEALGRAAEWRRRDEELRRMTALVQIAAQATASASLEQTLAAVGEHLSTLAPGAAGAVYVVEDGRPVLSEPPTAVAAVGAAVAALLREEPGDHMLVADAGADRRLAAVAGEVADAGVRSLLVVPLRFRENVIGAISLAAPEPSAFGERDVALLRRQTPSIVLALESAILSGHSVRLEGELSAALAAERSVRAELEAQEAIVQAIAEGWDRERASGAVARAVAELLDADATAVLAPAGGGLRVDALHVASPSLDEPVRRIVRHAPAAVPEAILADLEAGRSLVLEGAALGVGGAMLGPLLAPGSTAGFVPLLREGVLDAVLVAISLDPARPMSHDRIRRVERLAVQAAIAVR